MAYDLLSTVSSLLVHHSAVCMPGSSSSKLEKKLLVGYCIFCQSDENADTLNLLLSYFGGSLFLYQLSDLKIVAEYLSAVRFIQGKKSKFLINLVN